MSDNFLAMSSLAGQGPGGAFQYLSLLPYLAVFVIFYFLMIRPQQRRAKEHREQIAAVKKGDRIVTGGGMLGKVTKVDDGEVEIEIAPNVRVRVIKETLSQRIDPAAAKPAND